MINPIPQLLRSGILAALITLTSTAATKPHTIKSWQVNEDATTVYYSDTLSDGTETTRKVAKPKPREYPSSVTLIATNDLPVQLQYIYVELYPTGRTSTNYITRAKTPHERAVITLPPMPEVVRPEPGKTDALGQAVKRSREEREIERIRTGNITDRQELSDRFIFKFENGETKTHLKKDMSAQFIARVRSEIKKDKPPDTLIHKPMARPDRVISSKINGRTITHTFASGRQTTETLRRAVTARVASAPISPSNKPKKEHTK